MRRPRKPVPPNTVTVRPFVATMTQNSPVYGWSVSLLAVEEPIRAIERPINLARHDEVVLMQSFDLLGAQRDSSMTPAEADVRVMAFCLGKLTNFHEEAHSMDDVCTNWAEEFFSRMRSAEIGIHHHIAGAYLLQYAQERSWRGEQRPSVERCQPPRSFVFEAW